MNQPEKKEPRKKTESEKKQEQNASIDLWMNNLSANSKDDTEMKSEQAQTD